MTKKNEPGDLSIFTPHGNGVYGYQKNDILNPFKNAPRDESHGGALYFDSRIAKPDFQALMRICDIPDNKKTGKGFAVFIHESSEPGKDGYLRQMRLVSKFALRFMFDALAESDYNSFPDQKLTMADTLWEFIEHESRTWGTDYDECDKLDGLFGGDGDFAREELSFGFMVENDYHHVYRIWSRAWLVTK